MKRVAEGDHKAELDAGEIIHGWQPGHDLFKGQSLTEQARLPSQSGLCVMKTVSHNWSPEGTQSSPYLELQQTRSRRPINTKH